MVWVSCFIFVPFIFIAIFDKIKAFFRKLFGIKETPQNNINAPNNKESENEKLTNEGIKNEAKKEKIS